jgi:hypothetical protein
MTKFEIFKSLLQTLCNKKIRKLALHNFYNCNKFFPQEFDFPSKKSLFEIHSAILSFSWDKSNEGWDYWDHVYQNHLASNLNQIIVDDDNTIFIY